MRRHATAQRWGVRPDVGESARLVGMHGAVARRLHGLQGSDTEQVGHLFPLRCCKGTAYPELPLHFLSMYEDAAFVFLRRVTNIYKPLDSDFHQQYSSGPMTN